MSAKPDIPSRESREYVNPAEPIETDAGREFTIKMASNPTTGYKWELSKPPDERVVRLATNVFMPPDTRRLGAGGHEAWTFRATGPGRTGIVFQYIRPWEKGKPAGTNAFTVIVK